MLDTKEEVDGRKQPQRNNMLLCILSAVPGNPFQTDPYERNLLAYITKKFSEEGDKNANNV